eukprot:1158377-Pelagomonas_calceolata.AAC.1
MQCSSGSLGQVQLQGQMLGNLVINGQHPTIILYCNKAKRCCHQLHYNMQSQHPGQKKGRKNDCCPRPTLASSMLSHNLQLLMAYDNCQVHGQAPMPPSLLTSAIVFGRTAVSPALIPCPRMLF